MDNINHNIESIGTVFRADDGVFVKVYQKDALNEGCTFCHFHTSHGCRVKRDRCYVTFVAQPDPAPCTPNPSLAPMGEVTV